jgi:Site-specific recombinase XerD
MQTNRSTFSILFYLNTSKKKKSGKCPIMGRISVDGKSTAFSTGMDVQSDEWDAKTGLAIGKSKDVNDINRQIEKLQAQLALHYKNLVESSGYITAETLKNALRGIGLNKNTLMQEFAELVEEKRKSVGIRIQASTFSAYVPAFRHMKEFLWQKYGVNDIPFGQVDISVIEAYSLYLKRDLQMMPRTVKYNMTLFRTCVTRAKHKGLIRQDPFFDYTYEKIIPKRPWLTSNEIERLMQAHTEYATWNFTRDLFIFSTFTGIAIADLRNLKHANIQRQEDGSLWIVLNRQKTGTTSYIPLLDIPIQILNRYKASEFAGEDGRVFKLQTRQVINWQLKRLAKVAGIDKCVTFHQARFSFATTICLSQGIPIETLSQMMGHLSIKTTQIYAEVTRTKINEDMTNLAERIQDKYELIENKDNNSK